MHELLQPAFRNQRTIYQRQFTGMAYKSFSYEEYDNTRQHLIVDLHKAFTDQDRQLMIGFKSGNPDWNMFP